MAELSEKDLLVLKELHKVILEHLKFIHNVCEKYGIYYFANGGTCLGAVREKGIIPWDDDGDVSMFREDYEKFLEVAPKEIENYHGENKIYLSNFNGVKGYKIASDVDNEILGKRTIKTDLLTYDRLPKNKLKQKIMRFKLLSYRTMIDLKRPKMNFILGTYVKIMGLIGKIKTREGVYKSYEKTATKYNNSKKAGDAYISVYDSPQYVMNGTYPCDIFKERVLKDFEDTQIYVPKDYDRYLTLDYGDYMKRPEKENQVPINNNFHNFNHQ